VRIFITGGSGLLGNELQSLFQANEVFSPLSIDFDIADDPKFEWLSEIEMAFLCAGTKGFAECEGNRKAFRSDVDGNIRLARHLLKQGTFVVFVSTDAVEWALHTAYARNRFMVELAIGHLPNVAIFRPAKFDTGNVAEVARACAEVGLKRKEGLTRWP